MGRILMTGASGPIGAALRSSFEPQGTHVIRLVRDAPKTTDELRWNPEAPLPPALVAGFDCVIHLAGESVIGRWTAEKKKAICESRIQGTRHLAIALSQLSPGERPRLFICASAIGFYGDRADEELTEGSPAGTGFAADLSKAWEGASRGAGAEIPTINLRFGLVLSPHGGSLGTMLPPFKMGFGGRLGSGRQWWSWIHVDDIVGAVHHVLSGGAWSGPMNMVAPGPVRNSEFTRVLASVLGRPAFFAVPAVAARVVFGEMAQELMLASQRVVPAKLVASGYTFRFPELRGALENLV
jgi:uncharacterized protein (TIGR01777 family)